MAQYTGNSVAGGDGNIYVDNGGTWATVRAATTGTAQASASNVNIYASMFTSRSIGRMFVPFDTSSIPTGSTIDSATIDFYVNTIHGSNGTIHLVKSTQASATALVDGDFDALEYTTGGSVAISTTGTKQITLNATALTWIVAGGYTKLALIEEHDQSNTDPNPNDYRFGIYTSDNGSDKPLLTINYTPPPEGGWYFTSY